MASQSPGVSPSSSTKNLLETYQKVQKAATWFFAIGLILGIGCLLTAYFTKGNLPLTFKATLYTGISLESSATISLLIALVFRYLKRRAQSRASLNQQLTQPKSSTTCKSPDPLPKGKGLEPSLKIGESNLPKIPRKDHSEEKGGNIEKANKTLLNVEEMLGIYAKGETFLEDIKNLLIRDLNLKFFLSQSRKTPQTPTPTSEDNIVDRYNTLLGRIHSIEFSYHFHTLHIKKNGEVPVMEKGDCLFLAFLGTEDTKKAQEERVETVNWMKKNYKKDDKLQSHLQKSLTEYYINKQDSLTGEKLAIEFLLGKEELKKLTENQVKEYQSRLKLVHTELKKVEKIIKRIGKAEGKGYEKGDITEIEDILNKYFEEMSQPGKYAGHAEIYALSCRHKVCVKVYTKRGEEDIKLEIPPFNAQYETMEKPAISLTKDPTHFNLYFPPSESKSST